MDFKGFSDFLKRENKRLETKFGTYSSEAEFLFGNLVKLMEELGELSDQILGNFGLQRKEKNDKFSKQKLEEEFADVFIVLSLLGDKLDIDIQKAISQKMDKIKSRDY